MIFDENSIVFTGDGGSAFSLNEHLIVEKNICVLSMIKMIELHKERVTIVNQMKDTDKPNELFTCGKKIEAIDFTLQDLWGFPRDVSYHIFWNLPKCTCPKIDNAESWGIKNQQIKALNCPVHNKQSQY